NPLVDAASLLRTQLREPRESFGKRPQQRLQAGVHLRQPLCANVLGNHATTAVDGYSLRTVFHRAAERLGQFAQVVLQLRLAFPHDETLPLLGAYGTPPSRSTKRYETRVCGVFNILRRASQAPTRPPIPTSVRLEGSGVEEIGPARPTTGASNAERL